VNSKGKIAREGRRKNIDLPEYEALREALASAMLQSGVGQRELSAKLGKPFVYINRVLNAKRTLEFAEILEICGALNIDPLEIFTAAIRNAKPAGGQNPL